MRSAPALGRGRRHVDLHIHTVYSDGALRPERVVEIGLERQLAALAITDHDSLEGLGPARARAQGEPIELVPGLELSSTLEAANLHVLGYCVDPAHEELRGRLAEFREERRERARRIVEKLAALGAPVDLEEVMRQSGPGTVGRPHVAAALVAGGHVRTPDEAFRRFLGYQAPAYVARAPFSAQQAIDLVLSAGGVPVLAHPGSLRRDDLLPELVRMGLKGLEVWHPNHDADTVRRYRALARQWSLLETGGSDYHGPHRAGEIGEQPVPVSVLASLKLAAGAGA